MLKVYDIEIYINLFLIVFKYNNEYFIFEISPRKDDRHKLMKFLKEGGTLVGFRNVLFDYPILHEFIELYRKDPKMGGKKMVATLFALAHNIINDNNQWAYMVKKPYLDQIDLYLINHYDNFAKATSLKVLEFNLEMNDIRVLPYPPDSFLTNEQIDNVITYCKHDVDATEMFLHANKDAIEFRERMSDMYLHDFTNYNDVKIGEEILLGEVSTAMGLSRYEVKSMRTFRKQMYIKEIIFPYISFQSKEFTTLLSWWKKKVIRSTKGQFNQIPLNEVSEILPFANPKLEKGKLKNLNIIFRDFQFDFGTGGLHGVCYPDLFEADDKFEILHVDVSSYYPNLASKNGLHPKHIPVHVFVRVIDKMYNQRMAAKQQGDNQVVKAIKLSLNGALYGKSNSPFSFMYDPQFTMSICINGQLLLAMLAEQFMLRKFHVIQVNTDGIYIISRKDRRNEVNEIMKSWATLTRLKLDAEQYKLIAQRDVNNYLAVAEDGRKKFKGAFDYEYTKNGEYHKNYSMLVVAKALDAYFTNGTLPHEFLTQHDKLYDFFKRTKFDKNTRLEARNGVNRVLQNVTRYYVALEGSTFYKIMPPLAGKEKERESVVEVDYLCKEANDLRGFDYNYMKQNINYEYYEQKVQEIIDKIMYRKNVENANFVLVDDTI